MVNHGVKREDLDFGAASGYKTVVHSLSSTHSHSSQILQSTAEVLGAILCLSSRETLLLLTPFCLKPFRHS